MEINTFLDAFVRMEKETFLSLNSMHTPFMDIFMFLLSNRYLWFPVIGCLVIYLLKKYPITEVLLLLFMISVVVLCSDQIASGLIKPFCQRLRPTHYPGIASQVHTVFGYRGGLYGFISSHAANLFSVASFTIFAFRRWWYTLGILFIALLFAYSRIYLGVHFLSDIIPAMLIGWLIGFLLYRLYAKIRQPIFGFYCKPTEEVFLGLPAVLLFLTTFAFMILCGVSWALSSLSLQATT